VLVGDQKTFTLWVHETKETPSIIFNQSWWPGVSEGDLLRLTGGRDQEGEISHVQEGFYFFVPKDDGCAKPKLQVSKRLDVSGRTNLTSVAVLCAKIYGRSLSTEEQRRSHRQEGAWLIASSVAETQSVTPPGRQSRVRGFFHRIQFPGPVSRA
jgi:hypothetical protein